MLIDANELKGNGALSADVCIVGAGAAGIAMAVHLAPTKLRIVLLESGGLSYNRAIQKLSRGEVSALSHHTPLHLTRPRIIGGATTVWGGRCVPLDDIDFERRDYLPYSGWPISRADLLPYYEHANRFCEAGTFDYSVAGSLHSDADSMVPGFSSEAVGIDKLERYSCPTNFGRRYMSLLRDTPNLSLIYHATCTSICLHCVGKGVSKLLCKTLAGATFEVLADRFVLAMGCLESTRLLLASNDVMSNGIGNHSDKLGRFYMCHLEGTLGELRCTPSSGRVVYDYEKTTDGVYARRRFTIDPETQRERQIGNFMARLYRPNVVDPRHRDGILSAVFLTKQLLMQDYQRRFTSVERRRKKELDDLGYRMILEHVRNAVIDMPRLLVFSHIWVRKRLLAKRKLPPLIMRSRDNTYPLDINAEQSPDPVNRVTLTSQRDALGVPKLHVTWRMNEFDFHTIKTSLGIIGDEFRRSGCGNLWLNPKVIDEQINSCSPIGAHHIGTARMASDPSKGVVDENCRVHGVENLFVAGSAVFPTSGHANPMLTTVAVAMRLADHLKTLSF